MKTSEIQFTKYCLIVQFTLPILSIVPCIVEIGAIAGISVVVLEIDWMSALALGRISLFEFI